MEDIFCIVFVPEELNTEKASLPLSCKGKISDVYKGGKHGILPNEDTCVIISR